MTQSTPTAFITLGGAGSGKSTLSRHLSSLTGAAYLDKDTIAGPLVRVALMAHGQDPSDRESNELYLREVMPAEYETLFATAARNLELGTSVVLDAPFIAYLDDSDYLRRMISDWQWPDVRIRVMRVRASAEVVRRRLIERGSERDRVKLADWDAYWLRFGAVECNWTHCEQTTFDNDGDDALTRLRSFVERPAPRPAP